MSAANEKAVWVLDTPKTAHKTTHLDSTPDSKTLSTVTAAFALKGHALCTTTRADDGRITYTVSRWNQSRAFTHWNDVAAFLAQIGGAA